VPAVVGVCDETAAEVAEGRLAGARRGGRRRRRRARVEAMPEAARRLDHDDDDVSNVETGGERFSWP